MSNQSKLPTDSDTEADGHTEMAAEWQPPEGGVEVINYQDIPLPDTRETPRSEWSYKERRAEMLEDLKEAGHPDRLPKSQKQYADIYGVSQPMIHKDIRELRKYLRQTSGAAAIEDTEAIKHKAIMEALEDGDPARAFELQLKYNDFLFELGRYQKAPDRKQVQSVNVDADVTEGLTDEQKEHFEEFSEKLQKASSGSGDAVDVEAREVDDDE